MKIMELLTGSKKISLAAILILAVGCSEGQKEEYLPLGEEPKTVTAIIGSVEATTKTYFDVDNLQAFWKAGDKISVSALNGSGTDVKNHSFTLSVGAGKESGTFTEDSPAGTWPSEASTYLAIYPYSSKTTITGTGDDRVFNLNFPSTQAIIQGSSGDFSSGVMAARVDNSTGLPNNFRFRNLFSVIKLSVTGTGTLNSILFKDRSGYMVSGPFTLGISSESLPDFNTYPAKDIYKLIEYHISGGITLNSVTPTDIYLTVPARTYADGFQIVLEPSSGKSILKNSSNNVTLTAGGYYSMAATVDYEEGSTVDLSRRGTANCYTVPNQGNYSFVANVIGNGYLGLMPSVNQTTKQFHATTTDIIPLSARLIWQDCQGLISNINFNQSTGRITFTASASKGNAVIAAYSGADGTGDILWSWHIWCTDQPTNQVYHNASNNTFTLLDRHLGATSNSSDGGESSYGLFYQWGRKDPFIGPEAEISTTPKTLYDQNGNIVTQTNAAATAANSTLANTIKTPSTFYTIDGDWYYNTDGTQTNNYLWGNPFGYDAAYSASKTIYDPCPPGYMVAPRDTWTGFTTTGATANSTSQMNVNGSFNNGWIVYISNSQSGETTWYPANGLITYSTGGLASSGGRGSAWSTSPVRPDNSNPGFSYNLYYNTTQIGPQGGDRRASGFSVRCVKE